ncbi:hypothetical protein GCM10010377_61220 [Streptomyces viridiviolaceus]|nr:hypothetical protein GCM10010377_61220 [Streptomyces viridiviolaceus]
MCLGILQGPGPHGDLDALTAALVFEDESEQAPEPAPGRGADAFRVGDEAAGVLCLEVCEQVGLEARCALEVVVEGALGQVEFAAQPLDGQGPRAVLSQHGESGLQPVPFARHGPTVRYGMVWRRVTAEDRR